MSHFTVMVLTKGKEKVEDALAPYHEYECTGSNDEFVQDIDITEEKRKEYKRRSEEDKAMTFAEWLEDNDYKTIPCGRPIDREGEHAYSYALLDAEGEVKKVVNRTNPNAKWDWWVVGGRWRNFLMLKPGAKSGVHGERSMFADKVVNNENYADSALLKDIDLEEMRAAVVKKAETEYDDVAAVYPEMKWLSFKEVLEKHPDDIDKAREEYWEQPAMKAIEKIKDDFPFLFSFDNMLVGREAYVAKARASALQTFAFVKDGKWYEKGEMGWFGVSRNEDEEKYTKEFDEMLDSLDPNTRVTIVDCHI